VPPNCSFELDDIEADWTWKEGTADFIFARDLIVSIRDFPRLIDQCYKYGVCPLAAETIVVSQANRIDVFP
jgi:hypothetical protein